MNRDPAIVQLELDQAQVNLERHIGELKHRIDDKLDKPRHVIEAARKPFHWLDAHAVLATFGALALGALVGLYGSR
jgi:hypothetical protein